MRGEYDAAGAVGGFGPELPPHARRILYPTHGGLRHRGTTSACAENTACGVFLCKSNWNYLRMRGEYHATSRHAMRYRELPPHARRIQ